MIHENDKQKKPGWEGRIKAARDRREERTQTWRDHALLHTNVLKAMRSGNDTQEIFLPNGDQVKVGVVYRLVEQSLALLEMPEVQVSAVADDFTRELGREDTHRESIVSQALSNSLHWSGLVGPEDRVNLVKLYAMLCGHGISFSEWKEERTETEGQMLPVVEEQADGRLAPKLDAQGFPVFEPETIEATLFAGVRDRSISPLNFLFSADATTIADATWHGYEDVIALDTLKADGRYKIPDDIEAGPIARRTIYQESADGSENIVVGAVRLLVIYNKQTRELLTFIEAKRKKEGKARGRQSGDSMLVEIGRDKYPVEFDLPEGSPFSFFIPSPAADDPFGVALVEHIRNPAQEADKIRTRQANLTRQIKRIIGFDQRSGLTEENLLTALHKDKDFAVVGLPISGDMKDTKQMFFELPTPSIPVELFKQESLAVNTAREIAGVSETPYGGADSATESENMMSIGEARPRRRRRLFQDYLSRVAAVHKCFLARFAEEGQSLAVVGADGVRINQQFGREVFRHRYRLEAAPGADEVNASPVRQKMLIELSAQVGGKFGPAFDLLWLREVLTRANIRNINALMEAAKQGAGLGQPPALPGGPPADINLNDLTDGQALRAAINAPSEGGIAR